MKRTSCLILSILVLLILLCGAAAPELSAAAAEVTPLSFSCGTYDTKGNSLQGYFSEKDNVWYLFVTSVQSVPDVTLSYSGDVAAVSQGQLNAELGTVTGAFANSGDALELELTDGTKQTVVVMQSDLPSVHIVLKDTTLEAIHADKDKKHKGNNIYITDPNGQYDLTVEGSVEIKGRGNSTWREYEKKAYQIKFNENTSVMGMGGAKKWVLLANASDDSMIRTKLVYDMAEKLDMAFVPQLEFVDLWIDGEYRGTFLLGEKVEIGSSRLDLKNPDGTLFEHDEAFYEDETYWFYSEIMHRHFTVKEIVEEDPAIITSAIATFEKSLEGLLDYLYSTPSEDVTLEELSKMIDVDSFVRYYLVNEFVSNSESFVTSFYWYQDGPGDVLHLGPIWDYDTCLGNDGVDYTTIVGGNHLLFRYLLSAPAFFERVQELWEVYKPTFTAMEAGIDPLKDSIAVSADMNYKRWDVLGKPNPKGGADFYGTFDETVEALRTWLIGRIASFEPQKTVSISADVSDDCYTMDIRFADGNPHTEVEFAVWSMARQTKKVFWYEAKQDASGNWIAQVELDKHASAGVYRIDVYADGSPDALTMGYSYVRKAITPIYLTDVVVSEDCRTMTITMKDTKRCRRVSFGVWSKDGGQDDLKWYPASRNLDGVWECTIPLELHKSSGVYFIHVYSGVGRGWELVDYANTEVATAVSDLTWVGISYYIRELVRKALKALALLAAAAAPVVIFVIYRRKKRRK